MIQTVTGPIEASALGKTLSHEHFALGYPGYLSMLSHPGIVGREEVLKKGIEAAATVREQGFRSVMDATPNDCCRDPLLLREISEQTGLNILCATGYYASGKSAPGYWDFRIKHGNASEEYAEMLVQELTVGIRDTGIKAGFIKSATGYGAMTDMESHLLRGAAMAQKQTGALIYTHTENGELAEEQAAVLLAAGADPSRCVIGHLCGERDLAKLLRLLEQGFTLGFDRLGSVDSKRPSLEETMQRLALLAEKGYAKQIVLSQDTTVSFLGAPFYPDWENHYFGYLASLYLPQLRDSFGVSEDVIDTMLVESPRKFFA